MTKSHIIMIKTNKDWRFTPISLVIFRNIEYIFVSLHSIINMLNT